MVRDQPRKGKQKIPPPLGEGQRDHGGPGTRRLEAADLAGEGHRYLRKLGVALPSWEETLKAVWSRLALQPAPQESAGPEGAGAGRTREAWQIARTTLLELAAAQIGRGSASGTGQTAGPSGEPKPLRRGIRVLDELTEEHRAAACGKWLDHHSCKEIARTLLDRCSVKASPDDVRGLLGDVRRDLEERAGDPGAAPMEHAGCGVLKADFSALMEGESLLKRRRASVVRHIESCPACSRAMDARRESDRRIAGLLSRGVRSHPSLSGLEEYRTGISSSPTRRNFVERHLGDCAACRSLLAALDALEELDPDRLLARATIRRHVRRWLPWTLLAVTVLAAGSVVAVWQARERSLVAADFRHLGVLDVRVDYQRGKWPFGGLPREEDPLWREGSHAYREGQCADAASAFARYAAAVPDDPAGQLMLGGAKLCAGDAPGAAGVLEPMTRSEQTPVAEEAAWLLANARLAQGEVEEARRALNEVVRLKGRHEEDARSLLDRLP